MSSKIIIVPHDFTSVADCAVEHAVKTAEVIGGEVHLLHIVENSKGVEDARKRLEDEAQKIVQNDHNIPVTPIVRIGNIIEDIGDVASEVNAELIIMGTHGATGLQHLLGSRALKVITHSEVPFIIVQEKNIANTGYDKIVVPLDLHKETKQKLSIAANMAKYFNSKLYLITPNDTDEFLLKTLKGNIIFASNYLKEKGIEFETEIIDRHNFDKEIVRYASDIDADLISIMNLQKNSLMGMLGSSYEQNLITNTYQIPVLVMNPLVTTVSSGSVMFE